VVEVVFSLDELSVSEICLFKAVISIWKNKKSFTNLYKLKNNKIKTPKNLIK
jgi:hypothetical protein